MLTVWKFELPFVGRNCIEMPQGARVLHVSGQAGRVCLWASVDSRSRREERCFVVLGTGDDHEARVAITPSTLDYIGTAHLPGPLVWHVFEERCQ